MEVSLKLWADDKDINLLNMTQDFSFISQVFQPKFETLHNNFLMYLLQPMQYQDINF